MQVYSVYTEHKILISHTLEVMQKADIPKLHVTKFTLTVWLTIMYKIWAMINIQVYFFTKIYLRANTRRVELLLSIKYSYLMDFPSSGNMHNSYFKNKGGDLPPAL